MRRVLFLTGIKQALMSVPELLGEALTNEGKFCRQGNFFPSPEGKLFPSSAVLECCRTDYPVQSTRTPGKIATIRIVAESAADFGLQIAELSEASCATVGAGATQSGTIADDFRTLQRGDRHGRSDSPSRNGFRESCQCSDARSSQTGNVADHIRLVDATAVGFGRRSLHLQTAGHSHRSDRL